jgi:uncharacterized protein YndB with AHSA1/START domain
VTHDLRVERVYDAAPEVVFDAFTVNGQTRLTVVQSGFPAADLRDEFTEGWDAILAGLARVAATRTA